MILLKPTQPEAQKLADRCHAYLIANDAAYAASVAAGHTQEWCIPSPPHVITSMSGEAVSNQTQWGVIVDERVFGCLTAEEYTPPDPGGLAI
jgi:hypothetical protein